MSQFFINAEKDFTERFDMARFMRATDNLDPLTSAFIREVKQLETTGRFTIQGEESRPDFISYKIYGTTQLWWVILIYNAIFEIEELVNGKVLNFPSRDDIDALFLSLKARETARNV